MQLIKKKKKRTFYLIATSDIAFLLLIFLVITSSLEFSQEIEPPNTPYVDLLSEDYQSVIVEITKEGAYSILSYEFSISELQSILISMPRETLVKIYADRSVDFTYILSLLNVLHKDKRYNVFLMMEQNS